MSFTIVTRARFCEILLEDNGYPALAAVYADSRAGNSDELVSAMEYLAGEVPGAESVVRVAFRWYAVLSSETSALMEEWWHNVPCRHPAVCLAVVSGIVVNSETFRMFETTANKSAQRLPEHRFFMFDAHLIATKI